MSVWLLPVHWVASHTETDVRTGLNPCGTIGGSIQQTPGNLLDGDSYVGIRKVQNFWHLAVGSQWEGETDRSSYRYPSPWYLWWVLVISSLERTCLQTVVFVSRKQSLARTGFDQRARLCPRFCELWSSDRWRDEQLLAMPSTPTRRYPEYARRPIVARQSHWATLGVRNELRVALYHCIPLIHYRYTY